LVLIAFEQGYHLILVLEAIKKIGPHPFPVDDNLLNRLFTNGLMIG
jgi:hypothetical protein